MFLRRLGPDPHASGQKTPALDGCPDIFELTSGDIAIIGKNITEEARKHLPRDASCGPDECVVQIPRRTFVLAAPDLERESR